ncbi:MAG: PHP domain-containing protein [Bacilli bacterium]|nr:PHP domain-containing protein [Bacilli bacterium]
MKIDLHVHSNNSDGTMSVSELIDEAKKNGIDTFALTDHDTIQGIEEYQKLDSDYPMIFGIELSTYHKEKPVHILGYFKNPLPEMEELQKFLIKMKEKREERVKKIIKSLKEYFNIEVDYDEIKKNSHGVIARPHIARVISEKYGYEFQEVFDRFLNNDSPAYVEIERLSTEDGINLLKRNHAVTVLAHPFYLTDEMVKDIISYGIDGIEVYYLEQNINKYHKIAKKHHLIETGGSDYHGTLFDSKMGVPEVKESAYLELIQEIEKLK